MKTIFKAAAELVAIKRAPSRQDRVGGRDDMYASPGEHRSLRRRGSAGAEDDDLHAYVDGDLEPCRRARVEARLARCPDQLDQVAAYRAINVNLHVLFDRELSPMPAALAELSRDLEDRLRNRR